MKDWHIYLDGMRAPVRLVNCDDLHKRLQAYLPNWAYRSVPRDDTHAWATVVCAAGKFRLTTDFHNAPVYHKTEVNAVCDLIAKLSYQTAKENSDQLSLHMAAVEIGGRLVLFPAVRRAGKSLLSVALSRIGGQVFTDDALPLRVVAGEPIQGEATGVAPRIRLPLPENLGQDLRNYISGQGGPRNRQYTYVACQHLPKHGTRAPVGAVVLLEYSDSGQPKFEAANRGETLDRLIHHDFYRARDTRSVLSALHHLVMQGSCYRFTYSDPDAAARAIVEFFERQFADSPSPAPVPQGLQMLQDNADEQPKLHEASVYRVSDHLQVVEAEGMYFAADCAGHRIIRLDVGAMQILELLREPMSVAEVTGLLCTAFPEEDAGRISQHTHEAFRKLVSAGFVVDR